MLTRSNRFSAKQLNKYDDHTNPSRRASGSISSGEAQLPRARAPRWGGWLLSSRKECRPLCRPNQEAPRAGAQGFWMVLWVRVLGRLGLTVTTPTMNTTSDNMNSSSPLCRTRGRVLPALAHGRRGDATRLVVSESGHQTRQLSEAGRGPERASDSAQGSRRANTSEPVTALRRGWRQQPGAPQMPGTPSPTRLRTLPHSPPGGRNGGGRFARGRRRPSLREPL